MLSMACVMSTPTLALGQHFPLSVQACKEVVNGGWLVAVGRWLVGQLPLQLQMKRRG